MSGLPSLPLPTLAGLDEKELWVALAEAHRYLAELKGLCEALPNQEILIDTLSIQEAKDSSEVENIITTHDEIYTSPGSDAPSPAAKEVRRYVEGLKVGFQAVRETGLIRVDTILQVQACIEGSHTGFRKLPGTVLRNDRTGEVIYEPPQSAIEIVSLMNNLVEFIHQDSTLDPLLRMAIAHHQFESIHPFYDGNGRTGRILNLLILLREGLLEIPVLYLSRYITTTKGEYYRRLQAVRENGRWTEWCLYLVRGVALTARSEVQMVKQLRDLMLRTKHELRGALPRIYSQDLLNNLFRYPYTKIEFLEQELGISRVTAAKYLEQLHGAGFVRKRKIGRTNFYVNEPLFALLSQISLPIA